MLILALHYLVPLVGTLYAQKSHRKWIAYWVVLLVVNTVLQPVLAFCFGVTGGAFLKLVIGAGLLFVCNDEKVKMLIMQAGLLVDAGDMGVQIATQQYENGKEKVVGLMRQYGLVE